MKASDCVFIPKDKYKQVHSNFKKEVDKITLKWYELWNLGYSENELGFKE